MTNIRIDIQMSITNLLQQYPTVLHWHQNIIVSICHENWHLRLTKPIIAPSGFPHFVTATICLPVPSALRCGEHHPELAHSCVSTKYDWVLASQNRGGKTSSRTQLPPHRPPRMSIKCDHPSAHSTHREAKWIDLLFPDGWQEGSKECNDVFSPAGEAINDLAIWCAYTRVVEEENWACQGERINERRVPVVHCAAEVLEEYQRWIWGIEIAKVAIDITAGVGAVCWVDIVSVCQKEKAWGRVKDCECLQPLKSVNLSVVL